MKISKLAHQSVVDDITNNPQNYLFAFINPVDGDNEKFFDYLKNKGIKIYYIMVLKNSVYAIISKQQKNLMPFDKKQKEFYFGDEDSGYHAIEGTKAFLENIKTWNWNKNPWMEY